MRRAGARYEPRTALDGGPDGLAAYRALAAQAQRHLAPTARLVLEIGAHQGPDVRAIFAAHGLECFDARQDLAAFERCLAFRRHL